VRDRQWTGRIVLAVLVLAALASGWFGRDWITLDRLARHHEAIADWRAAHFPAALAGFFAIYVVAALVSFPGIAMLTLLGGYLFGGIAGAFLVVAAATLGATGVFLATRAGLSGAATRDTGRWAALARALRENEVQALLLLRLAPMVPFFVANALPAAMGVGLRNYVLTTAAGIFPGTLLFTVAGAGLAETLAAGGRPELSALTPLLLTVPAVILGGLFAVRLLRRGDAPQA